MSFQNNNNQSQTPCRQRGVVLIMSLVILLVLTLLGISAMNASNLQVIMAGNSQFQTTALNTAEQTLVEAQDTIDTLIATHPIILPDGYYDNSGAAALINLKTYDWADPVPFLAADGESHYIIEYTGKQAPEGEDENMEQGAGTAGDLVHVYRITARSTSSRGAVRTVQAVYVTFEVI